MLRSRIVKTLRNYICVTIILLFYTIDSQMKVYYSRATRSLVLKTGDYALVLRDTSQGKCLIEFTPETQLPPMEEPLELINKPIHGFLGLINVKGINYAGFISDRKHIGELKEGESIFQICDTIFVNFNGEISSYYKVPNDETELSHGGIHVITKLMATGTFYYSPDTDISLSTEDRTSLDKSEYTTQSNEYSSRFVWNNGLIEHLTAFRSRLPESERLVFDNGLLYITIIRGYVNQKIVNNGKLLIISRQDARKVKHLFGPFGMDDDGNVANFVETEMVIQLGSLMVSYLLVRGNVPLFWELDSHLLSTKLEFPRSEDGTKHAFTRFFETLCYQYGKVFVLDALSAKGSQPELSIRYHNAIVELHRDSPELLVLYKKLFNSSSHRHKDNNSYFQSILNDENCLEELNDHGALTLNMDTNEIDNVQNGVILVSTLDSIERSNYLMSRVSEYYLQHIFGVNNKLPDDLWYSHYELWHTNGLALGKLADTYNTSFKTKNKTGGIIGKVAEQSKKYAEQSKNYVKGTSVPVNLNAGRQSQLDRLLGGKHDDLQVGLIDPVHDYVSQGLKRRIDEYVQTKDLLIYTVTFNVNGISFNGDLKPLLFPSQDKFSKYDLVVVGLEEVIELTPSKVMSIDPAIRKHWERKLNDTLNMTGAGDYSLIRSEQLGGILLLVFSSSDAVEGISNIETAVKKTGFKGMSANKGGVAININYSNQSKICFIASHLAAGHDHQDERHLNYKTIAKGLKFSKNKGINDSDILIWMGDMNFRIQLPNDLVRKMLKCKPPSRQTADINNNKNNNNSEAINGEKENVSIHDYDDDEFIETSAESDNSSSEAEKVDNLPKEKDANVIKGLLKDEANEQAFISKLFEYDQLNIQMNSGKSFPFFNEMEIKFPPTYKFDIGTDTYDTSEKQRTPSWTDRILTFANNKETLQQLEYNSIPNYTFSDHRPVYAIFLVNLEIVDDNMRTKIEQELYELRKAELSYESILSIPTKKINDEAKLEVILKHGLPAPSGKVNRWWRLIEQDDNGLDSKKSKVVFPEIDNGGEVINPSFPTNPFTKTDMPFFVGIDEV